MSKLPVEIANFFLAMQAGRVGAAALEACFAEDAVYEEPFSGDMQRHEGRAAIMAAMARGWEPPMPEMRIEVTHVETRGDEVRLGWTCHSPAIPGGKGSGRNRYVLRNGKIVELYTTLETG